MKSISRRGESGIETILPKSGPVTDVTTLIPSPVLSPSSDEERLLSPKSLNECADHLLDSMDELTFTDHDDIKLACQIAKQIQGLAKVKLDIYKTMKSMTGDIPNKRASIIRLSEEGRSANEISKEVGCSEVYVYNTLRDKK